jgi:hypothetical protein
MSHAHHITALVHAKCLHMQNNNQSQDRIKYQIQDFYSLPLPEVIFECVGLLASSSTRSQYLYSKGA